MAYNSYGSLRGQNGKYGLALQKSFFPTANTTMAVCRHIRVGVTRLSFTYGEYGNGSVKDI